VKRESRRGPIARSAITCEQRPTTPVIDPGRPVRSSGRLSVVTSSLQTCLFYTNTVSVRFAASVRSHPRTRVDIGDGLRQNITKISLLFYRSSGPNLDSGNRIPRTNSTTRRRLIGRLPTPRVRPRPTYTTRTDRCCVRGDPVPRPTDDHPSGGVTDGPERRPPLLSSVESIGLLPVASTEPTVDVFISRTFDTGIAASISGPRDRTDVEGSLDQRCRGSKHDRTSVTQSEPPVDDTRRSASIHDAPADVSRQGSVATQGRVGPDVEAIARRPGVRGDRAVEGRSEGHPSRRLSSYPRPCPRLSKHGHTSHSAAIPKPTTQSYYIFQNVYTDCIFCSEASESAVKFAENALFDSNGVSTTSEASISTRSRTDR
jgi:hypothetical protein